MFTEYDLQELVKYKSSDPVISLYLNTEPSKGNADTYKLRMRTMLKDVNLDKDVEIIERYFDHKYDWAGRGVAIFSSHSQSFFKTFPLALAVADKVVINDRPYIKPFASMLDNYGCYGVALVDKQNLLLFTYHLGVLNEIGKHIGEDVKRTKRGGASTFPGRRGGQSDVTGYSKETVWKNIKESADTASKLFEENHVRRIIVGGSEENISMFLDELPKHTQSLVVDTIAASLNITYLELQDKVYSVCKKSEHKRGNKIVGDLFTNASKGRDAIIGLKDTLSAVNEARVYKLIVSDKYQVPGFRCHGCDFLTTDSGYVCLSCNKEVQSEEDIVERAISNVIRTGGKVEVIIDNEQLEASHNIGAILRY